MKTTELYKGVPGKKYGMWNCYQRKFQFGICEDTPMLARARLYQKIGSDANKWRFEPRQLPDELIKQEGGLFSVTYIENATDEIKVKGSFHSTKDAIQWVEKQENKITPLKLLVWDEYLQCSSVLKEL